LGDEIFGAPVEAGNLFQGPIDPQTARDYGAQFGPEIPEAVPFVGGMTPLEATLGGAATIATPFDAALTIGTAGLGPAVLRGVGTGLGGRVARTFLYQVQNKDNLKELHNHLKIH
jgi:hypothetical protein